MPLTDVEKPCSVRGCDLTTAYVSKLEEQYGIILCDVNDSNTHFRDFSDSRSKKAWIKEHCEPATLPRSDFWLCDSYNMWVCVNSDCADPRWDPEETYCATCYEPLVQYHIAVDKARCKAL